MLQELESLESTLNILTKELSDSLDYLRTLENHNQNDTFSNDSKKEPEINPGTLKASKNTITTFYLEYDAMFKELFNGESTILREKTEKVIREIFPLESINNTNNDPPNSKDLISMNETCLKSIVISVLHSALSLLVTVNPNEYGKVRFISEMKLSSTVKGTRTRFVDITILKPGFIVLIELKYISLGYVPYVSNNKYSGTRVVDLKRESDMNKFRKILGIDQETLYEAIYTDFHNGSAIDTSVEEKIFDTVSQVRNYGSFICNSRVKAYEYTSNTRKELNLPVIPINDRKNPVTVIQCIPFICFVSRTVNVNGFTV